MNKFIVIGICLLSLSLNTHAQKNKDKDTVTLKGKEAKAVLDQAFPDSKPFLRSAAEKACQCIDSVDKAEPDKAKKVAAVPDCIDREVEAYQMMDKLLQSMKSTDKKVTISIGDKTSSEYKHYYYDIERWLKDSCAIMNQIIATNDVERDHSYSRIPEAMEAYNKGVPLLQKEDYNGAIPYFRQAVAIDSGFAFAWDNLGICYRRTDQLDKAEASYKASLRADPGGRTPMQNLAVVYQLEKKDDEAIAIYQKFLSLYPDDPEVYYGLGIIFFSNKNDMENALQNMCKAYNIYVAKKSPYRTDAEKVISMIYGTMKKDGKEEAFNRILKENNIKSN